MVFAVSDCFGGWEKPLTFRHELHCFSEHTNGLEKLVQHLCCTNIEEYQMIKRNTPIPMVPRASHGTIQQTAVGAIGPTCQDQ